MWTGKDCKIKEAWSAIIYKVNYLYIMHIIPPMQTH